MSRMTSAALLAGATVLAALGVVVVLDSEPAQPVPVIPDTPPEVAITGTAPAPKGVPAWTFGNGTPRVFSEIVPGIYRTGGSTTPDWPMCRWKIFVGDRIIASGTATGPVEIVVQPQHTAVESKGCMVWRRVGELP